MKSVSEGKGENHQHIRFVLSKVHGKPVVVIPVNLIHFNPAAIIKILTPVKNNALRASIIFITNTLLNVLFCNSKSLSDCLMCEQMDVLSALILLAFALHVIIVLLTSLNRKYALSLPHLHILIMYK